MCSFPSAGDFQPVVWKPERIEVNPANNESNGLLYFFLLKEDSHLLFVQLSSCLKNVAVGDSTRNNICGWSLMAWSKGVKTGNTSVLDHVLHAKSLQPARKFHKVPCTNLISSLTLNEQKNNFPCWPFLPSRWSCRPTGRLWPSGGAWGLLNRVTEIDAPDRLLNFEVIPRFHGFLHSSIASSRYQVYMYP